MAVANISDDEKSIERKRPSHPYSEVLKDITSIAKIGDPNFNHPANEVVEALKAHEKQLFSVVPAEFTKKSQWRSKSAQSAESTLKAQGFVYNQEFDESVKSRPSNAVPHPSTIVNPEQPLKLEWSPHRKGKCPYSVDSHYTPLFSQYTPDAQLDIHKVDDEKNPRKLLHQQKQERMATRIKGVKGATKPQLQWPRKPLKVKQHVFVPECANVTVDSSRRDEINRKTEENARKKVGGRAFR